MENRTDPQGSTLVQKFLGIVDGYYSGSDDFEEVVDALQTYEKFCFHSKVREIDPFDSGHPTHSECLDCSDTFAVIGDDYEWRPKRITS